MSSAKSGSGAGPPVRSASASRSGRPRGTACAPAGSSSGWTMTNAGRSRLITRTCSWRATASRARRGIRTSSALIVVIRHSSVAVRKRTEPFGCADYAGHVADVCRVLPGGPGRARCADQKRPRTVYGTFDQTRDRRRSAPYLAAWHEMLLDRFAGTPEDDWPGPQLCPGGPPAAAAGRTDVGAAAGPRWHPACAGPTSTPPPRPAAVTRPRPQRARSGWRCYRTTGLPGSSLLGRYPGPLVTGGTCSLHGGAVTDRARHRFSHDAWLTIAIASDS